MSQSCSRGPISYHSSTSGSHTNLSSPSSSKVYLIPLRRPMALITPANIKSIFSEIEVILNYNALLLKEVEKKLATWSHEQCLGEIFLKLVGPLRQTLLNSFITPSCILLTLSMSFFRASIPINVLLLCKTDFLKVYTQYVNNFPKSLTTINACKQKGAFKTFLQVSLSHLLL